MEQGLQRIESNGSIEMPDVVRLWVLRMLVLGADEDFVQPYGFRNDRLASCLDLVVSNTDHGEGGFNVRSGRRALRKAHQEGETLFVDAVKLLSESFPDVISTEGVASLDLISGVVERCAASDLGLSAYRHRSPVLEVLQRFLRSSIGFVH